MRIVAGSRRGRKLYTGKAERFRPTSDRVREAVFSILGDEVVGRNVLDLYAGSGAFGFEALSRGAAKALFVEENRRIAGWIERNGRELGFGGAFRVVTADVLDFLRDPKAIEPYDLVFVDPPYLEGLVGPTLGPIASAPGERIVLLERERREEPELPRTAWREARTYGDTVVEFLAFGGDPEREEESR